MYMFLTTDYYGRSFRVHLYVFILCLTIIMKNYIIGSINRIQEKRILKTSLTITQDTYTIQRMTEREREKERVRER